MGGGGEGGWKGREGGGERSKSEDKKPPSQPQCPHKSFNPITCMPGRSTSDHSIASTDGRLHLTFVSPERVPLTCPLHRLTSMFFSAFSSATRRVADA